MLLYAVVIHSSIHSSCLHSFTPFTPFANEAKDEVDKQQCPIGCIKSSDFSCKIEEFGVCSSTWPNAAGQVVDDVK